MYPTFKRIHIQASFHGQEDNGKAIGTLWISNPLYLGDYEALFHLLLDMVKCTFPDAKADQLTLDTASPKKLLCFNGPSLQSILKEKVESIEDRFYSVCKEQEEVYLKDEKGSRLSLVMTANGQLQVGHLRVPFDATPEHCSFVANVMLRMVRMSCPDFRVNSLTGLDRFGRSHWIVDGKDLHSLLHRPQPALLGMPSLQASARARTEPEVPEVLPEQKIPSDPVAPKVAVPKSDMPALLYNINKTVEDMHRLMTLFYERWSRN